MPPLNGHYNPPRVLGPNGEPWQKEYGYDPNYALPNVLTFQSILSSGWQSYLHGKFDESIRFDRQFAEAMENDAFLQGLLQERRLGTASLTWRIDVDDPKDPTQKAIQDTLTRVAQATTHFQQLIMNLLNATFYGRYAAQIVYEKRPMMLPDLKNPSSRVERLAYVMKDFLPVHGDDIDFKWDGTPYILVNSTRAYDIPGASIAQSSVARALELKGSWRDRFILHAHEKRAASYWQPDKGSSVHGVGLRSVIHWLNWLRMEWLGNVADWCERTGLGVRVWYYQGGSKTSKNEVEKAAREQTDRTNILVPRFQNQTGRSSEGVEFVDTTGGGAQLLLELQKHVEEQIERYIIGQTLSSDSEGNGLGGSGVASLHAATKAKIINYDANNLADTLTRDWIRPLNSWMHPEYFDLPVSFRFNVNSPNPSEQLTAINTAFQMDVDFVKDEVRALTGMSNPQDGDETISMSQMQQQQAAIAPQPQDGDGDGLVNDGTPQQHPAAGGDQPGEQDFADLAQELGAAA